VNIIRKMALLIAFSLGSILFLSGFANAAKRVALVIGNSNYEHVAALVNPKNDADDITISLENVGFTVTKTKDLDYRNMRIALRKFSLSTLGADIALIYYAGHGIEVNRQNYLIPTDAQLKNDTDVSFEAMPLDLLSQAVSGAKSLRLILLDACRDNPFAKTMTRNISTRSIGRGLARIEPAVGTLVSYAAKEGTVAADGDGRNSPYSKALIKHLKEPGLEVQFLFRKVRDSVIEATNGQQEPFTYGSLPGKRIFLLEAEPVATPKPIVQPPVISAVQVPDNSVELAFWNTIKDQKNEAYFQAYLDQYPTGFFIAVARIKIQQIKILASNKQKSEAKKTELKPDQSQIKVAALDPGQATKAPVLDPKKDSELVRKIQKELNRVGCSAGSADGIWGRGSSRALRNFGRHGKLTLASLEPSLSLLDQLKTQRVRICPIICGRGKSLIGGRCKSTKKKSASKKVSPSRKSRKKTTSKPRSSKKRVASSRKKTTKRKSSSSCFVFNGKRVCD